MSSNSSIEWTDDTFNPWWGCTKVHSGCANCYAETWDARYGGDHWGKDKPRRMILGEWGKPAKWNAEAKAAGVVRRVFCASMCDLFEDFTGPVLDRQDKPVEMKHHPGRFWDVPLLRARTLAMVGETPNLLWLLLTKRPENVRGMVPVEWLAPGGWPTNVMVGTSPCNQETADRCIPELLKVPGRRFLSIEPLLGAVDLSAFFGGPYVGLPGDKVHENYNFGIHWVIVGGESGPGARPCDVAWIRGIVKQCRAAGVPCFVKQDSGPRPGLQGRIPDEDWIKEMPCHPKTR